MMELDHDAPLEELAQELLRRRQAQESLIAFSEYTLHKYRADPFHQIVAEHLEAVERGEIRRLMIYAPPQHGKSELSTRRFPAWYLGRNPDRSVISASYNAEFAADFGRNVRDIIFSRQYQNIFPNITIKSDSRAADRWELDNGGKYFSVGVSSGTTGRSAHLFLIDDPIKDRKDADSVTKREDAWNWYRDVAFTRLQDDAAIVMTLTRWHFDDLAGRALQLAESGRGLPWTILRLPALAEPRYVQGIPILEPDGSVPGDALRRKPMEPLAPSRFSLETLLEKKEVSGERTWSALYQQVPMSEQGGMFKVAWFKDQTDPLPAKRVRVRAWDLAASIDGDWTVGVLMSRDTEGTFYIENILRFRGSALEVERKIIDTAHEDGRSVQIRLPQDPGPGRRPPDLEPDPQARRLQGQGRAAHRPQGDPRRTLRRPGRGRPRPAHQRLLEGTLPRRGVRVPARDPRRPDRRRLRCLQRSHRPTPAGHP